MPGKPSLDQTAHPVSVETRPWREYRRSNSVRACAKGAVVETQDQTENLLNQLEESINKNQKERAVELIEAYIAQRQDLAYYHILYYGEMVSELLSAGHGGSYMEHAY